MSREEQVKQLLSRNVVDAIDRAHLERRLLAGEKLRVKLGIDPTSPDLHLGHAVVLRKLREFQDLGCKAVLIIGDFTARIGDPSGRDKTRPPLGEKEIKENMKKYKEQASRIVSFSSKNFEISYNSEWYGKMSLWSFMSEHKMMTRFAVQNLLKRKDFKKRLEEDNPIGLDEFIYPLFQAYDSVAVKADVEIGGTDQIFNLLMGRSTMQNYNFPGEIGQDVLTTPLLEGTDGARKMSKSYDNYIGLNDAPADMFGKIMSAPDKLVEKYFLLCTDLSESDIKKLQKELQPKDLKERLGFEIVRIYHGEKAAREARENFEKVFSKKEAPTDMPELKMERSGAPLAIVVRGLASSNSEARRLIEQGGFEIDGRTIKNPTEKLELRGGEVVRIGKKKFFRIKI
ncbi:MAG: tyrosine--tRNA ligase [Patescibacteria group bacterium]